MKDEIQKIQWDFAISSPNSNQLQPFSSNVLYFKYMKYLKLS